jgi:hypothetical protein
MNDPGQVAGGCTSVVDEPAGRASRRVRLGVRRLTGTDSEFAARTVPGSENLNFTDSDKVIYNGTYYVQAPSQLPAHAAGPGLGP